MQPVDHWVSKPESSRSSMSYSHQRVSFTVSRISSHVLLNVVLPFNLVTNLTGVSACLASVDTRLQVITTVFMAAVGLRYVSASYLPKVSYATFLDQYMWSCLLFVAGTAVVSMLSASVPVAAQSELRGAPPFSSLDADAWMALLFLWVAWNLWLLLCFMDHLCGGRRWRNVPYPYTQNSSRESEEQDMTWARWLRTQHLTRFSPVFCCSRRSPLSCVACTDEHLEDLRKKRQALHTEEEAFLVATDKAAAETRRREARSAEARAAKKVAAGFEGARIGSGRILCREHLRAYYGHSGARARGWGCCGGSCGGVGLAWAGRAEPASERGASTPAPVAR